MGWSIKFSGEILNLKFFDKKSWYHALKNSYFQPTRCCFNQLLMSCGAFPLRYCKKNKLKFRNFELLSSAIIQHPPPILKDAHDTVCTLRGIDCRLDCVGGCHSCHCIRMFISFFANTSSLDLRLWVNMSLHFSFTYVEQPIDINNWIITISGFTRDRANPYFK